MRGILQASTLSKVNTPERLCTLRAGAAADGDGPASLSAAPAPADQAGASQAADANEVKAHLGPDTADGSISVAVSSGLADAAAMRATAAEPP